SNLSVRLPIFGSPQPLPIALMLANQVFGYAIIASNYRRNDAPARNRIKIVVFALVCYLVAQVLSETWTMLLQAGYSSSDLFWLRFGLTVLSYAGLALLVYAVLRRKLFDLNFALN